jgi:hypothetical protein
VIRLAIPQHTKDWNDDLRWTEGQYEMNRVLVIPPHDAARSEEILQVLGSIEWQDSGTFPLKFEAQAPVDNHWKIVLPEKLIVEVRHHLAEGPPTVETHGGGLGGTDGGLGGLGGGF